jgi:hypothetical protein
VRRACAGSSRICTSCIHGDLGKGYWGRAIPGRVGVRATRARAVAGRSRPMIWPPRGTCPRGVRALKCSATSGANANTTRSPGYLAPLFGLFAEVKIRARAPTATCTRTASLYDTPPLRVSYTHTLSPAPPSARSSPCPSHPPTHNRTCTTRSKIDTVPIPAETV